MSKRSRQWISTEFRTETVRLLEASDKTMAAIARDLDISISETLSWVKPARMDNTPGQDDGCHRPRFGYFNERNSQLGEAGSHG
jgi:transposase-like protein